MLPARPSLAPVGLGAGITAYSSLEELTAATVDLGVDSTALVQEQLPAEGDAIVRIESSTRSSSSST